MNGFESSIQSALAAGDLDGAIEVYRKALRDADSPPAMRLEYAAFLWQCYRFEEGLATIEALRNDPRSTAAQLQAAARLLHRIGRYTTAADVMRTAVERCDAAGRAECQAQLAGCLERSNELDSATDVVTKLLQEEPGNGPALRLLARIDRRREDFASAVRRLDGRLGVATSEYDWGLRYELAANLDRMGEFDRAWRELELAKQQLASAAAPHLERCSQIRQRQSDLVRRITDVDLRNWHRTRPEPDREMKIALMAGFPRSGTTLLEQILASHPECVGTDETGILASQFTAPLVHNASDVVDAIIELRSFRPEELSDGRAEYRRSTESLLGEPIGDRWLVEKDPLLTPDLAVPLRLFPEARIIMPLRDPRDVLVSWFFTMVPLNWNSAASVDIVQAAAFYHDCMRHWLALRERLAWPWIETRYEQMVTAAETETRRITEFLGLDWHAEMLDENQRSSQRAVSTPTYDDISRPLYDRARGRWQNYERQLQPAMKIIEPWLRAFDYS